LNVFNEYADFYDYFYENKDYTGEVSYLNRIIDKHYSKAESMLDLGCGTGIHSVLFAQEGFQVDGVDKSAKMLNKANERKSSLQSDIRGKVNFIYGDIRNIKLKKKYDVVTSLFHVMSYQVTNHDTNNVLAVVKDHLISGGIMIFDCWYGPGVLFDPPEIRSRNIDIDGRQITRIAEPKIKEGENIVEVKYTLTDSNQSYNEGIKIIEHHNMRYFFKTELEKFLEDNGFQLLEILEWMSGNVVSNHTWSALIIARSL